MSYEIIQLAKDLNLPGFKPEEEIIDFCFNKIGQWLSESNQEIKTLGKLLKYVEKKLNLNFEEFYSDEELDYIVNKYIKLGEIVFATIKKDFNDGIFASLIKIKKDTISYNYIAVIDCRDNKKYRKYFSRWHEISHILTSRNISFEKPLHRSFNIKSENDPIEKLMDNIAGEIGFYYPIFTKHLEPLLKKDGFRFDIIPEINKKCEIDSSFISTLIACFNQADIPMIYIEVGLGLKKDEISEINQGSLFGSEYLPKPKLRVLKVRNNKSAKILDLTFIKI